MGTTDELEIDEINNNLMAAGGVYMALRQGGLPAEVITEDGDATNAIAVSLDYMQSRYRVTVERIPDDDEEQTDA